MTDDAALPSRRRQWVQRHRLAILLSCVVVVVAVGLVLHSDAYNRHMLVGRWHCKEHYSGAPESYTFLTGGSYASFKDGVADEVGTWDVMNGQLVMIKSSGGMSYARIRVSFIGAYFHLINSDGAVRARCTAVEE